MNDLLQKGFTRLYQIQQKEYLQIEDILASENIEIDFKNTFILIDRLVAKAFEQDELHRVSDSVQTAFDETNGDVFIEVDGKKYNIFVIVLNWMACALKNRLLIFFEQ